MRHSLEIKLWNYIDECMIALTGYVVPGCVGDGTWMLWEKSSAAVVVIARLFFLNSFLETSRHSSGKWHVSRKSAKFGEYIRTNSESLIWPGRKSHNESYITVPCSQ